jgi:hypothetical protein
MIAKVELLTSLEAYSIAGVASTRFAGPGDFDDLASPQTIISCDRIRQLDPGQLRLL